MILIFNKEYRQLDSIMSDLRKKIKKSEKIEITSEGQNEVFNLDTVNLYFHVTSPQQFTVKDKAGHKILSINWHLSTNDEIQSAKFHMISSLLNFARQKHHEYKTKAAKFKQATEKAQKAAAAEEKRKATEQANINVLSNALDKLREL